MSVIVDIFPCRTDNYGYLVHDLETRRTAAIDAPDAGAIVAALNHRGWFLTDIFVTHHHRDHTEGIAALKAEFGAHVVGPRLEAEKITGLDSVVAPGETLLLGATVFEVIGTPGHTLGQIALFNAADGHVFTADALFSLGCGRMLEGRPGPMWEGLKALRALPDATLMFCGHEYTADNARFALAIDPRNAALNLRAAGVGRLRAAGQSTIPVTIGMERATNPFLRCDNPAIAKALGLAPDLDPSAVFAALRSARDGFT